MLSTSSFSKTLIRENLKRYWLVPMLGFLGLILTGILPVLMNYHRFIIVSAHAEQVVSGSSLMINTIIVVLAITSSVLVFSYLHDQTSSNAYHALPADRSRLFTSATVSGWLLTIIPIVVFGLMMTLLGGAVTDAGVSDAYDSIFQVKEPLEAGEIYTFPHILGFVGMSIITATFTFAISCLAAVLTGRNNIHSLLAPFLFVLPETIVILIQNLCEEFLPGFDDLGMDHSLLNPISYAISSKETFRIDPAYDAYYIFISIAILALSFWIYKKVKLERVGEATTFPVAGDVLAALLAIIETVTFSMLFVLLTGTGTDDDRVRFLITAVISSMVFYAAMRMIADSSTAVINAKNLKKYGVCLAVLAVIMLFIVFDVTGYGRRVPNVSEVASVHLDTTFPYSMFEVDADFEDPEVISLAAELQQAAIDGKNVSDDDAGYSEVMTITWKLKNKRSMTRKYDIKRGKGFEQNETLLDRLFNNESYRKYMHIDVSEELNNVKMIEVYGVESDLYETVNKEDWEGLLNALNKDLEHATYEDLRTLAYEDEGIYTIELDYPGSIITEYSGKYFTINEKYSNTMGFLKDKAYIK